jgi:hypothetical protein
MRRPLGVVTSPAAKTAKGVVASARRIADTKKRGNDMKNLVH